MGCDRRRIHWLQLSRKAQQRIDPKRDQGAQNHRCQSRYHYDPKSSFMDRYASFETQCGQQVDS